MNKKEKIKKPHYLYNPVTNQLDNINDPDFMNMNKVDLKKDYGQPVLNTQRDYENYIVENDNKKARDETAAERADRHMFIFYGAAKPKHYDDPFIKKVDVMAGLPEVNKLVDQKLQDNKTLNYINKNKNMYQKENNKMLPTKDQLKQKRIDNHTLNQFGMSKPKLADVPILARNINRKTPTPVKTNPTIERYKNFKEEKKFKEEEKKFNKEFEKEYGTETIKREMRAKENKYIKEGK